MLIGRGFYLGVSGVVFLGGGEGGLVGGVVVVVRGSDGER